MKKIVFIMFFITSISLMSFNYDIIKSDPPCNIKIKEVNDSTYVISNNNNDYHSHVNIVLGSANIIESGDTIGIFGSNYNAIIVAFDSTGCVQQKIINKLN